MMKRLLKLLMVSISVIVLFTACEQFLKDPEDFLSYWASEAFVKDHSIGSEARPDVAGVPCVSSSENVTIMLTVHNPKNFPLVMPSSSEPAGIVEFKELSHQPEVETHYDLEQTASGRLKLTYKKAFLQKYEQGSGSLNPTITLKAKDGRVFKQTYTFGIKSNTPPPKPEKIVIAKTKGSDPHYVLCLKFDSNEMTMVHKDINNITIKKGLSNNGSSYKLSYKGDDSDFQQPAGNSFITHGSVAKLTEDIPKAEDKWVLYYKTDIKIANGNPQTSYTITLHDEGGVVSDEAVKTIKASGPTRTVTFSVEDGRGGTLKANYGSNPFTTETSTVQVPNGTTVTFTATPYSGWEVDSWSGNVTGISTDKKTATLSNVTGNTTVTVRFKKVGTVAGSDMNAWTLLKNAVKVADPNSTITIDGKITASKNNSGEIVIDKTLKIKGKTGAGSDILNANTMSRIFKVGNGATLTLENLTLTGGKATGTGDAGSGGAIFARGANDIKIINCIITGNEAATNGGGLNVEGTPTTITNCTFTGNTAKNGGGIYIIQASKIPVVTIEGGTIGGTGTNEANKATGTGSDGNGGGIYVGDLCKVILQNDGSTGCTIKGNTAQRGGGVYANNADVSMNGGTQIAVNEVNNDVYLDNNSLINVAGPLTAGHPVARITPKTYSLFPQVKVLDGSAVGSEHGKFAVTPKGNQQWEVGSDGKLKMKN